MAVSTMTAPEVEPRQRLTKWLIGAASVVMRGRRPRGAQRRRVAQIQQMWEDRFHRSSHSPQAEEVA